MHALEDGTVKHDTQGAVCAHDHAAGPFSIGAGLDIDLEGPDATLLPLLVGEAVQLALVGEDGLLILLAGFNCGFSVSGHSIPDETWRVGYIPGCSTNRSSVFSATKVSFPLPSSSCSLSLSSLSDCVAPRACDLAPSGCALALESPKEEVTLGDAKLVSPPDFAVAGKALLNAENPVELAGFPNTEVEVPAARLPNGESSEPANADKEDAANAEVEAGLLLLEELLARAGSFAEADKVVKGEVAEVDAIEDLNAEVDVVEDLNAEVKGESVEVFPNALEEKVYQKSLC